MDQDSFRLLLTTSASGSPSASRGDSTGSGSRRNLLSTKAPPNPNGTDKKASQPQPMFKPRKIKKAEGGAYRDRAAERRAGGGNDYAHVEAILEDFERRNASTQDKKAIEEQRKYLGGDSEHSILVKGLDMALLEQNRARATLDATEDDDDTLEQAYIEASSLVPKKRTREDIINEIKRNRNQPGKTGEVTGTESEQKLEDDTGLLEAKKQGKFKPIGFKPIGESDEKKDKGKKKKKKKLKADDETAKESGEAKKKKRKVEVSEPQDKIEKTSAAEIPAPAPMTSVPENTPRLNPEPEPEPEPLEDDFDIFAGAGDYEGVDLGDDDDDDDNDEEPEIRSGTHTERRDTSPRPPEPGGSRGWFVNEDDKGDEEAPDPPKPIHESLSHEPETKMKTSSSSGHGRDERGTNMEVDEMGDRDEGDEEQRLVRLQGLSSSALPSIREFLAMDEALQTAEKRRKRKEKKKGK